MSFWSELDSILPSNWQPNVEFLPSADETRAMRLRLVERILNDGVFNEYRRATKGRTDRAVRAVRITEPWMALGEQRMYALLLAHPDANLDFRWWKVDGLEEDGMRLSYAWQLFGAQTFLWTAKTFNIVRDCPLPPHIVDDGIAPFPFMYHCFESAYDVVVDDDRVPFDPETDGMICFPHRKGLVVLRILTATPDTFSPDLPPIVSGFLIPFGKKFPDDFEERDRGPTGQILSMLAFINSTNYTEVKRRRLPRSFRRHVTTESSDQEKIVNVVVLRQTASDAVKQYDSDSREWKHRWWVRGHFRAQWYPTKKSHQVIWVAPHLKGPTDKPILEKVYAIQR